MTNEENLNLLVYGVALGAIAVTGGIGLGYLYQETTVKPRVVFEVKELKNKVANLEAKVTENTQKIAVNEEKTNMTSLALGNFLGYVAAVDFNGDGYADKIIPYSSGLFKVQINDGKGNFIDSNTYTALDMMKLTQDYFFKMNKLLNTKQVEKAYKNNPETLCMMTKLAKDYDFWIGETQNDFIRAYMQIQKSLPKKVSCDLNKI